MSNHFSNFYWFIIDLHENESDLFWAIYLWRLVIVVKVSAEHFYGRKIGPNIFLLQKKSNVRVHFSASPQLNGNLTDSFCFYFFRVLYAQRHSMFGLYVNLRMVSAHRISPMWNLSMCILNVYRFGKRTFFNCFALTSRPHIRRIVLWSFLFLFVFGIVSYFSMNALYTKAKAEDLNLIVKEKIVSTLELARNSFRSTDF